MARSSESRQAPLTSRLRVMTAARIVAVVATIVAIVAAGSLQIGTDSRGILAIASAGYLGVNVLLLLLLGVVEGRPRYLLDLSLIVDAVWATIVLIDTGAAFSPFIFVMYLQLVAATVLFGGRTGLKLSILDTIGIGIAVFATTGSGGVGDDVFVGLFRLSGDLAQFTDGAIRSQAAFAVTTLWLIAGATAYFSSVNERELRQSNQELAVLRELNTELERSLDLADVSQAIARGVVVELNYRRAVMWMSQQSGELVPGGAEGFDPDDLELLSGLTLAVGPGPVGRAVEARAPQLVPREHARPAALADAFEIDSPLVIVPLISEGRLLGLLTVEIATPLGRSPRLRDRDVRILGTLATEASLALDNARLHAELRDLSVTDALTGVFNHRYFQQRLQEELDRGMRKAAGGVTQAISLILMDIDFFKKVNDRFGHPSGDELLRSFARLTQRVLRSSDVVCRYGGEEFAIILTEANREHALHAAERLREAVELSNFTGADGRYLGQVTASFGVATYGGGLPSRSELITHADEAMYMAKNNGRNRVEAYEPDLDSAEGAGVGVGVA